MNARHGDRRWTASLGLMFSVLFLVGFVLTSRTPAGDASAARWTAFYEDRADAVSVFAGAYLLIGAGLAFVWFAAVLRERIVRRDDDGVAWPLAGGCALLYVAMLFATALLRSTVAVNVLFADNRPTLGPGIVRTLDIVSGLLLLIGGALAAAVFVFLVSRLGSRAGVFPKWLAIAGYVVAVLVSASFLYIPALALYLWTSIVSLYLLFRSGARTTKHIDRALEADLIHP